MDQTPWSERWLDIRLKGKKAGKEARAKAGAERIPDTRPSHVLTDYAGEYEHPAYGILKIGFTDEQLQLDFHKIQLPMTHFHYDRFDTPDDQRYGKWSVSFVTNPQGDIDKAVMSLDEGEVTFTRKPETLDAKLLQRLTGTYETATGFKFQVIFREAENSLYLVFPGQPDEKLIPYKGLKFRMQEFSDVVFEFVEENNQIKSLKQTSPSGEYVFTRK